MSDQNHSKAASEGHEGGHGEGGHEIDSMPNQRLFNLLFGLSALTLLCCIGLIQVFNKQADAISSARAREGSFVLRQYQAEMKEALDSYGTTPEEGRFRMPVEKAKQLVLSDPSRLQAFPPPAGWVHPDDLASGGAAPAAGPSTGAPAEGAPSDPAEPTVEQDPSGAAGEPAPEGAAPGSPQGDGEQPAAPSSEQGKADDQD